MEMEHFILQEVLFIKIKQIGYLEIGESFESCGLREGLEETNLKLKNFKLLTVTNDVFNKEKHYITILLRCETENEQDLKIMEPEKNEFWEWKTWDEVKRLDPLFLPLKNMIKQGVSPFE